ncbi:DUF2997 domain-containing protein [Cylindrospermopsis raciborskii]|uniref:DUF2997 domain-containing protein n=1 Tax=Cylindrospermopsis raciborskii CENA302 TaxID=1170768 RepID=A0A9Q5WAR4_9CYAN|nr:DUF2997 domain-containing protein [Cylindrospermopsis raciborskii]MCZ2203125.1 DUF2997 domain-containing protein [Cylindrospermopsis raciborskii PAMP2012]MCZ2207750.1 DUF2997 domain-containing protein [Cylindrospermopsis raciborskii PAMP2011]NLQ04735.1 DUF2997 domain-containing protein [Cylindrospermopsis raciborskii MVCC19]OHY32642.1 hypothetical protein BCV64_02645 [Cylindrospermopsis raciborskii MVCC14]OPH10631.1 hypothetical protein CENA302_02975 [Cylindrospermopsis raciborskii CENA302]
MAEYQRIEYRIDKQGRLVEKVLNGNGSSCTETTRKVEENIGEVERRELLPEYYKEANGNEETAVENLQSFVK